jgi:hypothetical protein
VVDHCVGQFLRGSGAASVRSGLDNRARIDPDANWNTARFAGIDDLPCAALVANISGVNAKGVDSGFGRRECQSMIEMNVGDKRDRRASQQLGQSIRGRLVGNRDPYYFASNFGEFSDLPRSGLDIGGIRDRHRLNHNVATTADSNVADMNGDRRSAFRDCGH